MLNLGVLTFKEFAMREPLPLATIHEAVLEFLRGRDDVVVFGADPAYCAEGNFVSFSSRTTERFFRHARFGGIVLDFSGHEN